MIVYCLVVLVVVHHILHLKTKQKEPQWKQKHVKVGVGTIVFRRGQNNDLMVLLGRRKGSHGEGKYALPGGHLELGESISTCAVRELEEETGLKTAPENWTFAFVSNDVMPKDRKHYITIFLQWFDDQGNQEVKNMEPHKCEKWEWHSFRGLRNSLKPEQLFEPMRNLIHKSKYDPLASSEETQQALAYLG
mmetsp:Transcript_23572/g.45949  ORF Transcript_23572/g.45949 Transcript_23572/m.45949 type:complete len:191 (+) Transcript_23572:37-609(+)